MYLMVKNVKRDQTGITETCQVVKKYGHWLTLQIVGKATWPYSILILKQFLNFILKLFVNLILKPLTNLILNALANLDNLNINFTLLGNYFRKANVAAICKP